MDAITRREKLYAKICWPEIDTQRTRFVLATGCAECYAFPVYTAQVPDYRGGEVSIAHCVELGIEHINIGKWIYHGKRRHLVARWGYSPRLNTVVIREVRTAHNWAIYCDQCTDQFTLHVDKEALDHVQIS